MGLVRDILSWYFILFVFLWWYLNSLTFTDYVHDVIVLNCLPWIESLFLFMLRICWFQIRYEKLVQSFRYSVNFAYEQSGWFQFSYKQESMWMEKMGGSAWVCLKAVWHELWTCEGRVEWVGLLDIHQVRHVYRLCGWGKVWSFLMRHHVRFMEFSMLV